MERPMLAAVIVAILNIYITAVAVLFITGDLHKLATFVARKLGVIAP